MTTSLSFQFGQPKEYFPPEIVIDPKDPRNTPVVYFPALLVADDEPILQSLKEAAWQASKFNDGNPSLSTREETIDSNAKVVYVSPESDDGQETVLKTSELKLARYGMQIIKVFGPLQLNVWEPLGYSTSVVYSDEIRLQKIDLSGDEQLVSIPNLNQPIDKVAEQYNVTFPKKGGLFNPTFNKGNKQGFFYQQGEENDNAKLAIYKLEYLFGNKTYARDYPVPCNRGMYQGRQIQRLGRRKITYQETLQFQADKEKQIKYWYVEGNIRVISWTTFKSAKTGRFLQKRPNNAPPTSNDFNPKPGAVFYAEEECYGSLTVEYEVEYTEYALLYDFPEPCRHYEVTAGSVEKIGFVTNDVRGNEVERGDVLNGNDIGYDKKVADPDAEGKEVATKLIKKIRFLPFHIPTIDIYYTNGRQGNNASFTPPEPDFMDLPLEELPRMCIHEQRRRERTPSGSEVEHIEELTYVDVMGNVVTEKMEDRQQ